MQIESTMRYCFKLVRTLLLLLSHFSHVRFCATPQTAAHQAPLSLGFSRQEHWSGLPLPAPMHESEVAQSCPTLRDPMDCSLPGSSVHGIFTGKSTGVGCHFSDLSIYVSLSLSLSLSLYIYIYIGLPVHYQLLEFTQTHLH